MMRISQPIANRLLAVLVFCGLASRMFVPQGFMPASLDEGVGIKFCPAASGGMAHHEMDPLGSSDPAPDEEEGSTSTVCPLGAIFTWGACPENAQALPALATFVVADLRPAQVVFTSSSPHARPHPRGPPARFSLSA